MLRTVGAHALCPKSAGLLVRCTKDLVPIARLGVKLTTCLTYRDAWSIGFTQEYAVLFSE